MSGRAGDDVPAWTRYVSVGALALGLLAGLGYGATMVMSLASVLFLGLFVALAAVLLGVHEMETRRVRRPDSDAHTSKVSPSEQC